MQEQDARQELLRQLADLGEQVKVLAGQMMGTRGIAAERLADLQAAAAQLTDIADELEQYIDRRNT